MQNHLHPNQMLLVCTSASHKPVFASGDHWVTIWPKSVEARDTCNRLVRGVSDDKPVKQPSAFHTPSSDPQRGNDNCAQQSLTKNVFKFQAKPAITMR